MKIRDSVLSSLFIYSTRSQHQPLRYFQSNKNGLNDRRLANYSVAYEETQSNRVSDFRDIVCSLFVSIEIGMSCIMLASDLHFILQKKTHTHTHKTKQQQQKTRIHIISLTLYWPVLTKIWCMDMSTDIWLLTFQKHITVTTVLLGFYLYTMYLPIFLNLRGELQRPSQEFWGTVE